jgi:hypothetical protein
MLMIRRLALLCLLLPCAAVAQSTSVTTVPCGGATLAPMPTSLPVPEMARAASSVATCINLLSYTERLRQPAPVTTPAGTPAAVNDQLSNRFYMTQNGRRMTADEFDAWMRAKGIRVATGRATPAVGTAVPSGATTQALPAPTPPPAGTPAAPAGCVASATQRC